MQIETDNFKVIERKELEEMLLKYDESNHQLISKFRDKLTDEEMHELIYSVYWDFYTFLVHVVFKSETFIVTDDKKILESNNVNYYD